MPHDDGISDDDVMAVVYLCCILYSGLVKWLW
jgi:hypothetical protein